MKRMKWLALSLTFGLAAFPNSGANAQVQTFNFPDFSNVSMLQLNGNTAQATATDGHRVLRLTNTDTLGQSGSAFVSSPINLQDDMGFRASFSTFFSFQISSIPNSFGDSDGPGADGIVFVVQTVANNVGGSGGGIGYSGIPRSLGIEYDTYNNGSFGNDPNGNHVGIDLGGNIQSTITQTFPQRLNDSDIWNSWVDYNGDTQLLEVRLSQQRARPVSALLSATIDLPAILQQPNAFVGFTSGTGSGIGNHDIRNWQFINRFNPMDNVPEPSSLAACFLGTLALGLRLRCRK